MIPINIHHALEMEQFGARLARSLKAPLLIYLYGDLGVGKTTLTRGILTALGHSSGVKSPTYTLVESYPLEKALCYHFDFYRVNDPEELEYMGIRDYLAEDAICIVEWPERGASILPEPDMSVRISYSDDGRLVELQAHSERGKLVLQHH